MALKFIALHYFHRDTTLAIAALDNSVGGVKVSIVAFQAIDPGSIPGWRTFEIEHILFWKVEVHKILSHQKTLQDPFYDLVLGF